MEVPVQYAYLLGDLALLFIWVGVFFYYKDTRREMLTMSVLIGLVSVATAHYWWTVDWWHPMTLTGTRVGIEDFLMGFAAGGIMAVIYEGVFKQKYYIRKASHHYPGGLTIALMLAFFTSWLFWGVGLTSFYASTVAMLITAAFLFYFRRDLFLNGFLSGLLMAAIAFVFYYAILLFSPGWFVATYDPNLSGIQLIGIPVEEFIFWFLAGLVFGPFYEYWQGEQLRKRRIKLS